MFSKLTGAVPEGFVPAQVFSLACLGIVLHADVVGVDFVTRHVRKELREVQPSQELHRVRGVALASSAGREPLVERQGEGQREREDRAVVEVRAAVGGSRRAAPTQSSPAEKAFPLRVYVHRSFEEFS